MTKNNNISRFLICLAWWVPAICCAKSNPFRHGCLKQKGKDKDLKKSIFLGEEDAASRTSRVCNSNDQNSEEYCSNSNFSYPELRIHNGDWDSSFLLSWIYQIVLMEFVGVPASVGLTTEKSFEANFYAESVSETLSFSSISYAYEGIEKANEYIPCPTNAAEIVQVNCEFILPECQNIEEECAHILPEVWTGQRSKYVNLEKSGVLESSPNGMITNPSFMVPTKTAKEYPILSSFYGLQANPTLVASLFRKPKTWNEYCKLNDCTESSSAAQRNPVDATEGNVYYSEGLYTGYFEETEQNKCSNSTNLEECHGYFIAPNCDFPSFAEGQLFWNKINLKMDGPEGYSGGYNVSSMHEIWRAANATESHVMMWWNVLVDTLAQEFFQSNYNFEPVQLPQPNPSCLMNRPTIEDRCSKDEATRRGSENAACDYEASQSVRLISKSLERNTSVSSEAFKSPAYDVIQSLFVSEYDISLVYKKWFEKKTGTDNPEDGLHAREAVCEWIVENIGGLENIIPEDYPKTYQDDNNFGSAAIVFAKILAVVIAVISSVCMILTCKYRGTKVMTFAQPIFILLVLIGFFFVSVAAYLHAEQPTNSICLSAKWIEILGYTIELIPVLVKTSAMNRLIESSKHSVRININHRTLLTQVAGAIFVVVVYMIVWTELDPPRMSEKRIIDKKDKSHVILDEECLSGNDGWEIVSYIWNAILLLLCAYLAFQSREIASVVNDSKALATMVYSQFLFLLLRLLTAYFDLSDSFGSGSIQAMRSLFESLDVFFAISIYIIPKVVMAIQTNDNYATSRFVESAKQKHRKDEVELKILVCSANLGNSKPSLDSMEAWIPSDGSCSDISPLDGISTLKTGVFDIIVIGMQEASWKSRKDESFKIKGKTISEQEILNSLERPDSAKIREQVQEIIGDDYIQVLEELRGQMRLSVWASRSVVDQIGEVKVSGANTGIGNVLANKGAIVATIECKKTIISFVSAHLAAHEGESYYKSRCRNIRDILREAKTSGISDKLDVTMSSHHVIFFGDLNFRTSFGEDSSKEDRVERALQMIEAKDYQQLYNFDELNKGIKRGDLLFGFETLDCLFPPTFKVQRETGFTYKKQRTPSYTDRILFKSAEGIQSTLMPLAYEACVDFITSDHKPIRGAFAIRPIDSIPSILRKGRLSMTFRNIKCSDLPAADRNGLADPYIMFLWSDDIEFERSRMSFFDKMKMAYSGRSWPKTRYVSKSLDPSWEGQEIVLKMKSRSISIGAMLYLLVLDHDDFKEDDFMCGACVNIFKVLEMPKGETHKTLSLDKALTVDGNLAGRIQFQLDVKVGENQESTGDTIKEVRRLSAQTYNFQRDADDFDAVPLTSLRSQVTATF